MKTLYISDLDGTLLNADAELSGFTRNALNRLIARGVQFSAASARTAATVVKIFDGVPLNVPAVLMNGVCVYDLAKRRYIKPENIPAAAKAALTGLIRKHGLSGFLYSIDGDRLSTFYENTASPNAKAFMEERVKKYRKVFTRVEDFSQCLGRGVVYYSISDRKEKLLPFYNDLQREKALHTEFYRDVYNEDFWYLEVCAGTASKYNAVNFLRERYGFERVVAFGDNLNDLPLFAASDACYAVENAKPEITEKATGVIGRNTGDGVARWLLENAEAQGFLSTKSP